MAESDSDNDSYFEQLAKAAAGLDDEDPDGSLGDAKAPEAANEEEYYCQMAEAGASSNAIASESDMVWQQFMKESIEYRYVQGDLNELPKTSFADNMLLVDWLFTQLPFSSSLFHLAKGVANAANGDYTAISKEELKKYTLYVDDITAITIAVLIRVKPGDISCCLHTSNDVIDFKYASILAKRLKELSIVNEHRKICYMALCVQHLETITRAMDAVGSRRKWKEPAVLYSLHAGSSDMQRFKSSLPDGYTIGSLDLDDASIINDTWKYQSDHSLQMVESMITKMPCAGVKDEKGKLCAWCLCYTGDCSIGMAFTLQDHRSKGLAKATAVRCVSRFIDRKEGSSPFCYIVNGNEPSVRVFQDYLGFQKVTETFWAGFSAFKK